MRLESCFKIEQCGILLCMYELDCLSPARPTTTWLKISTHSRYLNYKSHSVLYYRCCFVYRVMGLTGRAWLVTGLSTTVEESLRALNRKHLKDTALPWTQAAVLLLKYICVCVYHVLHDYQQIFWMDERSLSATMTIRVPCISRVSWVTGEYITLVSKSYHYDGKNIPKLSIYTCTLEDLIATSSDAVKVVKFIAKTRN